MKAYILKLFCANFLLITLATCDMLSNLEKNGVIPDVIDKTPPTELEISYANNLKVNFGNELTPSNVKNEPTSLKWNAEEGSFYLLAMVDPDAPSRKEPKFREWHHWLVANIPGHEVSQGDVLSEYVGAGPPQGTDLHRYVFLVYRQPSKLQFNEQKLKNTSGKNRGNFNTREFAAKYKLGEPIAANFFTAKFDDYVPILQKQLQGK